MPITCPIPVRPLAQDEFARIDYQVMRLAFDSQNALGRLCDEVFYQNDLAARIQAAGLATVRKEVPVTVSFRDFAKVYSLDFLLEDAAIYDLKAATSLALEHEAQLLNYLFLRGSHQGKLINFRPAQVESRFVNTTLTIEERRRFDVQTSRWHEEDERSKLLRTTLLGLLGDWGAFLELPLYLEALIHFLGGEETVLHLVPLNRDGIPLGNQRLHLLTPETAFRVTAMADAAEPYERHLVSLLRHSPLRVIHWINMARHQIQFVTLQK
jgi:GxxExxY protein